MVALEQPQLLGVQAEFGALRVEGVDPREERRVEMDGVLVGGEPRGQLGLQLLQVGVVSALVLLKNTRATRRRVAPLRSSASTVLAKVGDSVLAPMAAVSCSCSAMPCSKAGR
ncbi:hypothetical protein ACFQZC_30090 [Streptacidiphilus monticola]